MSTSSLADYALLVVDVQRGFDDPSWGRRNNPEAEKNISRLINHWRENKRPVIHIQHCSLQPASPLRPEGEGCQFKPEAMPREGEVVFRKTVNSAFIGTDLEKYLRQEGLRKLVIVGLTSNHCVSTTVRMAGNLGFETIVGADATATFDRVGPDGKHYTAEEIHAVTLASLHQEFATVLKTAELLS